MSTGLSAKKAAGELASKLALGGLADGHIGRDMSTKRHDHDEETGTRSTKVDVRSLVVGQQSLRYSPVYGLFVPGTVQGRMICCARETACCVGEPPWNDSKDSLWVANIPDDIVGSGSAKQGTGLTEPTWVADGTKETEQRLAQVRFHHVFIAISAHISHVLFTFMSAVREVWRSALGVGPAQAQRSFLNAGHTSVVGCGGVCYGREAGSPRRRYR